MTEEWRPVVGFEGLYSVSNLGRVRAEARVTRPVPRPHTKPYSKRVPEGVLSQHTTRTGHMSVGFSVNSVSSSHLVHRLVATAFLAPNPEGKNLVLHRNSIPGDNRVANLYWGDHRDNRNDFHQANPGYVWPFSRRTHCKNGHEFTPENTHFLYQRGKRNTRSCRACQKERYARRKASGSAQKG